MTRQGAAPVRLGVLDAVHIGATWRIRLNHPCAAAKRPYVKLLRPLLIFIFLIQLLLANENQLHAEMTAKIARDNITAVDV